MPSSHRTFLVGIADGSADVRSALHCLVEQEEGCRVIAEDASAQTLLRTLSTNVPDILFLDAALPGGTPDGLQLLKRDHPGLTVILMSPDACPRCKVPATVCCVISKKDPPEAVRQALQDACLRCGA